MRFSCYALIVTCLFLALVSTALGDTCHADLIYTVDVPKGELVRSTNAAGDSIYSKKFSDGTSMTIKYSLIDDIWTVDSTNRGAFQWDRVRVELHSGKKQAWTIGMPGHCQGFDRLPYFKPIDVRSFTAYNPPI